ncbi:MAG: type II secretion system major pseudopilin GspG [Rhodospirillaceae bacterium]|nr:type II secretion system major pseudopilin GspG [Rhodospirillaceae bacterium]
MISLASCITYVRKRTRVQHSIAARGFTLLEMLVVLVIIGLLAGLVGPQLLGRVDTSKVTAADTQIKMLKAALATLRLDIGRFPTQEEGLSLLMSAPTDEKVARKWRGPYLSEEVPMDPWNNAYVYRPLTGTTVYLVSYGADGQPGGEGVDADIGVPATENAAKPQ